MSMCDLLLCMGFAVCYGKRFGPKGYGYGQGGGALQSDPMPNGFVLKMFIISLPNLVPTLREAHSPGE